MGLLYPIFWHLYLESGSPFQESLWRDPQKGSLQPPDTFSILNRSFYHTRLLVVFGLAVNSEITPEGMGHERNVVVFIHSATLLGIALGFLYWSW